MACLPNSNTGNIWKLQRITAHPLSGFEHYKNNI